MNPNGHPSFGSWTLVGQTSFTTVPSTWTTVSTGLTSIAQAEGFDFEIRLYGTAVNGQGNFGQVRFDNLRGESG